MCVCPGGRSKRTFWLRVPTVSSSSGGVGCPNVPKSKVGFRCFNKQSREMRRGGGEEANRFLFCWGSTRGLYEGWLALLCACLFVLQQQACPIGRGGRISAGGVRWRLLLLLSRLFLSLLLCVSLFCLSLSSCIEHKIRWLRLSNGVDSFVPPFSLSPTRPRQARSCELFFF